MAQSPFATTARTLHGKQLTANEHELIRQLDDRRRLQLLRFIVPGLCIFLLVSLPGTFVAPTLWDIVRVSPILVLYAIALWATFTQRAAVASLALLVGMTSRAMLVIIFSGPIMNVIAPVTIMDFSYLLLPIIIASIFTEPRTVAVTSLVCIAFTLGTFLLIPRSTALNTLLDYHGNIAFIALPIALPILVSLLLFAGTIGYRRLQLELDDMRIALAREKAIERLREQFISHVNHELRTPIMALQSYLAMAQELRKRGDVAQEHKMIDEAGKVTEDLEHLVKSVLNLRRLKISPTPVALAPLEVQEQITQAITAVERWNIAQAPRDLRLTVPPGLRVQADAGRLQEILTNLLSNAMKYSPQGSTIEVIAHSAMAAGKPMVEISVRDFGNGIPVDEAVLLFEPFVRLERDIASSTLGTGLGLSICRTHAEAMGGKIWLESSGVPGEGTTFYVQLQAA